MAKKKLTETERKKLLKSYRWRESQNMHSRNAYVLIERFGSKTDLLSAKKKMPLIRKRGYVTHQEDNWFYKKGHKHYSKLLPRKKKR